NGRCRCELRHDHDLLGFCRIDSRAPVEEWLPTEAVTTAESVVAIETVTASVAAVASLGLQRQDRGRHENAQDQDEKLPHLPLPAIPSRRHDLTKAYQPGL